MTTPNDTIYRLLEEKEKLLEACKVAFERLTDNDMVLLGSYGLTKQLERAIAKAEGRNDK